MATRIRVKRILELLEKDLSANEIAKTYSISKHSIHRVASPAISCYYVKELTSFLPEVDIRPVLVQNEIHPYYQDVEATEFIQSKGIAVQAWYPLGGRGYSRRLLAAPVICALALRHGKTAAQVILRWNVQRKVLAIPGSSNPEHIRQNLDIFDFELTDDEMNEMAMLERKEKHDWY